MFLNGAILNIIPVLEFNVESKKQFLCLDVCGCIGEFP